MHQLPSFLQSTMLTGNSDSKRNFYIQIKDTCRFHVAHLAGLRRYLTNTKLLIFEKSCVWCILTATYRRFQRFDAFIFVMNNVSPTDKLASFKQIWKILVRTTFFWRHKPSNMVWTSFSRNVHHIANWLIIDRWYHSKSRTISKDAAIIACDSETSRRYQNLGERRSLIGTNVKRSQRWKTSTDEVIDTSFETIIFNKNHSCDKKFRSRDQHLSDQSERSPPPRKHVHQSHQRNFIDEEYDDVDQRDFFRSAW